MTRVIQMSEVRNVREIEYLFFLDGLEKKRIARSASNKNRTGKGALRFPSDYKTKKEVLEMNGDIRSWNMDKPMTAAEFRQLPIDLKREYFTMIFSRFKPSAKELGRVMQMPHTQICKYRKMFEIPATPGAQTKQQAEAWALWIGVDNAKPAKAEPASFEFNPLGNSQREQWHAVVNIIRQFGGDLTAEGRSSLCDELDRYIDNAENIFDAMRKEKA